MPDKFHELRKLVSEFISARDWKKFHTPKNLAMSIAIESAELMEVFQWLTNEESNEQSRIEELRPAIEDEVADILIYLLSFANRCNINLNSVVKQKMARNEFRFPIEKIKGKLG